jgi:plasmid maintenance system antidote protein VapI
LLTEHKISEIITAMMTQTKIAAVLKCSQPTVNVMLTGKRPVSWPIAVRLAELFPGKTLQQWKEATPEDLTLAFEQLRPDKKGAV